MERLLHFDAEKAEYYYSGDTAGTPEFARFFFSKQLTFFTCPKRRNNFLGVPLSSSSSPGKVGEQTHYAIQATCPSTHTPDPYVDSLSKPKINF